MNLTIDSNVHRALVLVGPTAVGKTELSLSLAHELGGEIVSADSRQVYKFMDIGTAKPTKDERAVAPHHFIDVKTPDQYYSAGEYGREARQCIGDIFSRGKTPIIVGGSGFYIQALVDGLFAPKISDPIIKEKWREKIRAEGIEQVFAELRRIDPETAEKLHQNDEQRVVRALEVWDLSGKPISSFRQGEEKKADFEPIFIGLNRERPELYQRIEERVDVMFDLGLVDEVNALSRMGYSVEQNALRTVGYHEVFEYLDGGVDYEQMVDKIKMNTRRYAKRQLTWFRKDARINWFFLDALKRGRLLDKVISIYRS